MYLLQHHRNSPKEVVQEELVKQGNCPSSDSPAKKEVQRIDAVRSTLYNPIPEQFGQPKIIDSMKDIFKTYKDMQIKRTVPETNN